MAKTRNKKQKQTKIDSLIPPAGVLYNTGNGAERRHVLRDKTYVHRYTQTYEHTNIHARQAQITKNSCLYLSLANSFYTLFPKRKQVYWFCAMSV